MHENIKFRQLVEELVSVIPAGRVMTYGQIATICGKPRAARIVGGIAHFGNTDLPWQRVVKKDGSLASGYPGGVNGHKRVLESEGVTFHQMKIVNMQELLWRPKI